MNSVPFTKNKTYNVFIRWILIPFSLVLFWLSFSIISVSYNNFTVLQYPHYFDSNNTFTNKRLLKGVKIVGQFKAKENNLGIVSVKFGNVTKTEYDSEDILIFRIKEKFSNTWIYENTYRSGLASANSYLPIGFNKIPDSKGKTYIFELESLKGNTNNSLVLSGSNPIYVTKYQLSKTEILGSLSQGISFLLKKIQTLFINIDLLLSTFIFASPLCIYIFYQFAINTNNRTFIKFNEIYHRKISSIYRGEGKSNGHDGIPVLLLCSILLVSFMSLIRVSNSGLQLLGIGIWVLSIYRLKLNSVLTYLLSFILICISTITVFINSNLTIDNSSTMAYFLLCIAIIQDIIEYTVVHIKT